MCPWEGRPRQESGTPYGNHAVIVIRTGPLSETIVRRLPDGRRSAFATSRPPLTSTPLMREGLERRRAMAMGDPCPCGAVVEIPPSPPGPVDPCAVVVVVVDAVHADGCPAGDAVLSAAISAWKRGK